MQVQSALYNGHEIVKTNHAPAVVHDSEDTLELAEITERRMLEKIKSPIQLSAEQIFWSSVLKPISEMTMYPPNTPEKLVPRFLNILRESKRLSLNIQKALKEMKEIFKQMEAEVEQNVIDKQLLYSVMNDGNTISKFSEMHDACIVEQARCLKLKAEISELKHKIQKDDHRMDNAIRKLKDQISQIKERCSEADRILNFKALDFQNLELIEKVTALQEQNALFREEKEKVKHHYKELNNREVHLDYLKHLKESVETLREIVEEARIEKPLDNALGNVCFYTKRSQELLEEVISSTKASGSKSKRNTKNTRILPAKSNNKKKLEDHLRNNKSNLKQKNRVDSSISSKLCCKISEVCKCPLVKDVLSIVKQVWKETRKLFVNVGYQWKPTGRKFTLGEQCPLTRFTKSKVVPLQQPKHVSSSEIVITETPTETQSIGDSVQYTMLLS
ncbi:hypothetical protein Tco_0528074 [Tanacetum coccineum]